MGKNQKLLIGALAVLIVALLVLVIFNSPVLALGFLVLGGLGVVAFMARLPGDDGGGGSTKTDRSKGKGRRKLDHAIENQRTAEKPPPAARTGSGGGLPAWNPTALDTWTPPSLSEPEAVAPVEETGQWDTWDNDWATQGTDTLAEDESNPLDELDRLDDIDPIAEVERLDALDNEAAYDPLAALDTVEEIDDLDYQDEPELEVDLDLDAEVRPAKSGGFSFASAPPVINEEVETADDIMAASQATELELPDLGEGGDSELARLLAKVQARLSAYE